MKKIVLIVCCVLFSGIALAGGGGYNWTSFGGIQNYHSSSSYVAPLAISCLTPRHSDDLCVICKVNDGTVHCTKFNPNSLPSK